MPLTSVISSLTRATGGDEEWVAKMFANLAAHGMTLGNLKDYWSRFILLSGKTNLRSARAAGSPARAERRRRT
jgi:hypothetical protein